MKPVIAPPLLPYPSGNDIKSLRQFDADLRRSLVEILTQYAFRINGMLPSDGSEPATGGILFPATQIPSTNPNILDDYEENTFTPTITFATPGDIAVTYDHNNGRYIKTGKSVEAWIEIVTTAFTHTTSAGEFRIEGLPFTAVNVTGIGFVGEADTSGFTWPGGRTNLIAFTPSNTSRVRLTTSGSGLSRVSLGAADHATGTNVVLIIHMSYEAAN